MSTLHHPVRVVGPSELKVAEAGPTPVVWTVSKATEDWQQDLSPFFLGPVPLYSGKQSRCMENAWQYAKVYADQVDDAQNPSAAYWAWAEAGWARTAVRYPKGKGAKPLYLWWEGEKLGYFEARRRVYWPLYRDAVRKTHGFSRLQVLHRKGPLTLFDFDGFDHERQGLGLRQVSTQTTRPMGHAFILKAMLLYGDTVSPDDLDADLSAEMARYTAPDPQTRLF